MSSLFLFVFCFFGLSMWRRRRRNGQVKGEEPNRRRKRRIITPQKKVEKENSLKK
jgi:hypothetical protein